MGAKFEKAQEQSQRTLACAKTERKEGGDRESGRERR
jgi:hypothetical protein